MVNAFKNYLAESAKNYKYEFIDLETPKKEEEIEGKYDLIFYLQYFSFGRLSPGYAKHILQKAQVPSNGNAMYVLLEPPSTNVDEQLSREKDEYSSGRNLIERDVEENHFFSFFTINKEDDNKYTIEERKGYCE